MDIWKRFWNRRNRFWNQRINPDGLILYLCQATSLVRARRHLTAPVEPQVVPELLQPTPATQDCLNVHPMESSHLLAGIALKCLAHGISWDVWAHCYRPIAHRPGQPPTVPMSVCRTPAPIRPVVQGTHPFKMAGMKMAGW